MADRFLDVIRLVISDCLDEVTKLSESGTTGWSEAQTKILIDKLFRPLLPADIGIHSGQIGEHLTGRISPQVSIIFYDTKKLDPVFHKANSGFFPIECVLYAIHIISDFNAPEVQRAHENAECINSFPYCKSPTAGVQRATILPVRNVILSMNLQSIKDNKHALLLYKGIYDDEGRSNSIQAICNLGQTYCADDGTAWMELPCKEKHDELLAFISDVIASYQAISASRIHPSLAQYLTPRIPSLSGPLTGGLRSILYACTNCKKTGYARPASSLPDITIRGTLKHTACCPKCGAAMVSAEGTYEFLRGRLITARISPSERHVGIPREPVAIPLPSYLTQILQRGP